MLWLDEHKVSSPHSVARAQVHSVTLHNLLNQILRHLGIHHVVMRLARLSKKGKKKKKKKRKNEKKKTTISQ